MMNYETTRLYYSTDTEDGALLEVLSVQMESRTPAFVNVDNAGPIFTYQDAGKLTFMVRGQAPVIVNLFNSMKCANWTIEMPNGMTFMFQGYVEAVDQSLGISDDASAQIKVRISGQIQSYYDGPVGEPDATDVFSRKASRAQSKVLAEALYLALDAQIRETERVMWQR